LLCEEEKAINGSPGIRKIVANLEEEFMGEIEIGRGEFGVKT